MSISIVINNYNYGRFLGEAIRSALEQTVPAIEVIIVDDGSTDNSREVIESFGDQVVRIYQENGGQAAAFNTGIKAAKGEWVWLLDADDFLKPNALETAVSLVEPGICRVAMGIEMIDAEGRPICNELPNRGRPFRGTLYDAMLGQGYLIGVPTSGNLFRRDALLAVLPVPEQEFRICADAFLFVMSAIHGHLKTSPMVVANYRVHGANNYFLLNAMPLDPSFVEKQLMNALRVSSLLETYGRTLSPPQASKLMRFWHCDQIAPLILRAKLAGMEHAELAAWPWHRVAFGYLSMLLGSPLPLRTRARICRKAFNLCFAPKHGPRKQQIDPLR